MLKIKDFFRRMVLFCNSNYKNKELDYKSESINSHVFDSGQEVFTINDEYDIELIIAGTKVTLISLHSKGLWKCRGLVNSEERALLIFQENLSPTQVLIT